MIEIFNPENETEVMFKNYNFLFEYIKETERKKLIETGETHWSFVHRSDKTLSLLYHRTRKALENFFTEKEREAFEKGLSILEMCNGNCENPTQIILTQDINIKEVRKKWCRDYCLEHGYTFSETNR